MSASITLHVMGGPPGSELERAFAMALDRRFRPAVGPFARAIARVSGPADLLDELKAGLPDGPAVAEAVAVRARRRGYSLRWGEPDFVADAGTAVRRSRAVGRSAVEVLRSDPSLLTETVAGGWYNVGWRWRAARLAVLRLPGAERPPGRGARSLRLRLDAAFWRGVRDRATPREWRRLTGSSYATLVYHRFAGVRAPGQGRVDIAPARFARQMRALRALGFRELSVAELLAFHSSRGGPLPRRRYVVTVDDGFADNMYPLAEHAARGGAGRTQLYVPAEDVGGQAYWLGGERLLDWDDLRVLADAGIVVGSHADRHVRLTEVTPAERRPRLASSRRTLQNRLAVEAELLAYPNGAHDADVCADARAAGFRGAFTTAKGRNGAGTDPYCLRRTSIHAADGVAAVLWKVTTGDALPGWWRRARALLPGYPG